MGTKLGSETLPAKQRQAYEAMKQSPVTVLQIGEGNFLRGFFDWMIHRCQEQGLFHGSVALTQPRPTGRAKINTLQSQDGLYTLVTRGLENGERVENKEILSVFSTVFDPYSDWQQLISLAESPDLRFVVSNTTEAGLVYNPEPLVEGEPIQSFPGKIAWLLYRRYLALGGSGSADNGLIFLPCELLERNGDELKRCVLQYCADWSLPEPFREWVSTHNRFLNSLVDRIVTGYPAGDQAEAWFSEWGYEDAMLTTAEPYHFWAIEADSKLDEELPLQQAGLNVRWVEDLRPYQLRKVRILNGAHTLMTPLALLHGEEYVRDVMENPQFGAFVREAVAEEIVPTVAMPQEELMAYAEAVYERFLNPFINHRLADIAMNSISKFRTRLLPTLLYYVDRGESLPPRIVKSLAALLRYYQVVRESDGFTGRTLDGTPYTVRDDAASLELLAGSWSSKRPLAEIVPLLLSHKEIWGSDLSAIEGLTDGVTVFIREMEASHVDNNAEIGRGQL
ncbi:tagaturonate reductase [Paenibacillus sp. CF384]|uniref:tagaturonate reductase n=1 Tax=Paenibacillus sp. CF384 TaxID=1884382 RepID=UPI0008976B89|nr:tagaturonate reductase [Paenibacillus sp. CF384]SDX98310.1 tagaturonate reductase [Paenibacillus sp. CF384]